MSEVTYVIRYIYADGNRRFGEFTRAKPPLADSTPDIRKAKHYKDFQRAYTWSYFPQINEILKATLDGENYTLEVIESRYRGITFDGRIDPNPYCPPK